MQGTILIVDNDQNFTQAVRSALQNQSVRSTICEDITVDQIKSLRPGAILLNAELPRTSGFSICGRIKKEPDLKTIPIVVTSNDPSGEALDNHAQRSERANLYLCKPINPEYVASTLIELMDSIPPPLTKTGEVTKLTTGETMETTATNPISSQVWPSTYFDRQLQQSSAVDQDAERQVAHDPIELLRFRIKQSETRDQNFQLLYKQMQEKGQQLASLHQDLQRILEENEKQLAVSQETSDQLKKQLSDTEDNFRDFHNKVTEIFAQKDQEEQNLGAELDKYKNQVNYLKNEVKSLTDKNASDQNLLLSLQGQVDQLTHNTKEEAKRFADEKNQLITQIEEFTTDVTTQQNQIQELSLHKNELEQKIANQQSLLGQAYERSESLKHELQNKDEQILSLTNTFEYEKQTLLSQKAQVQQSADDTLRELRDEIELLQKEYDQINESNDQEIQQLRTHLHESHEKAFQLNEELEKLRVQSKSLQIDKQKQEDLTNALESKLNKLNRDTQNEQNRLYAELEQIRSEHATLADKALDQEIQFSSEIEKSRTDHAIAQQELLVKLHQSQDQLTEASDHVDTLSARNQQLQAQVEQLSQQLRSISNKHQEQSQSHKEALAEEQRLRSNAEQLHAQTITTIHQQNAQLDELKTALEVTLDQQKSSLGQIADAHQQIFDLRDELNKTKSKLAASENNDFELATTPFNPALGGDSLLRIQELQSTIDDQHRALEEAHRTINELRIEFSRNQRDLRQLEANLSSAEQARLAAEKQRNLLQKELEQRQAGDSSFEELQIAKEQVANLSKLLQQQEALLLDSNVEYPSKEEITLVPDSEAPDLSDDVSAPVLTLEEIEAEGLNFSSFQPMHRSKLMPASDTEQHSQPNIQSEPVEGHVARPARRSPSSLNQARRSLAETHDDDDRTVIFNLPTTR